MTRRGGERDLDDIARLYGEHVPGSSLKGFGAAFVREYLRTILASERCITVVAEENDRVAAFIMAACDTSGLVRELSRNISLAARALLHPVLALKCLFYLSRYPALPPACGSELLCIAVAPQSRRKGIALGLVRETLQIMEERGIARVRVSTLAGNEAANALLRGLRFEVSDTMRMFGKEMHMHVLDMAGGR